MTHHNKSAQAISWDEIEPLLSRMYVWSGNPEAGWFHRAWRGLEKAGLTSYANETERHWVYLRALALGMMYGDYCYLEWDEPVDMASALIDSDLHETLRPIRIGAMAHDIIDSDETDDETLFLDAIQVLAQELRLSVYDAILREFGDSVELYIGLYLSRESGTDYDRLGDYYEDVFDSGYETRGRAEAFGYVNCAAMVAVDA